MLREDKGRDQGDTATNQGMSIVASKPPEAQRQARNRVSLTALRKNQPWWHLDFRLPASKTETINLCGLNLSVCGSLLWET